MLNYFRLDLEEDAHGATSIHLFFMVLPKNQKETMRYVGVFRMSGLIQITGANFSENIIEKLEN